MSEVNSLTLNVKSDSVVKAAKSLEELEKSAKGADKASSDLVSESKALERQEGKTSRATNKLEDDIEDLNKDLVKSRQASDGLTTGMSSTTKAMVGLAAGYVSFQAIVSGGKFLLSAAADMETLETSFVSITGSIEAAKEQVAILTQFTASTPFQLEGVAKASRQLITAKGDVEGLTDTLKILGDISSTSAIPIEELAAIYTKAFNKGKIQAEELNQISERGIPIIGQLAKQMGVTREEVFKLGSEGKLAFADLEEAFIAFGSEGGFAFGAMERQSQTLNGQISTLKDTVGIAAASIGADLAEAFNVSDIIEGMRVVAEYIGEIGKSQRELLEAEMSGAESVAQIYEKRADFRLRIAEIEKEAFEDLSETEQKELLLLKIHEEKLQTKLLDIDVNERKKFYLDNELEALKKSVSWLEHVKASGIELTQAEEYRLTIAENQEKILLGQLSVVEDIIAEANKPTPAINQALVDDFTLVEKSLRTQAEIINEQFKTRETAIQGFQGTLESVANLTAEQVDRIDKALSRAKAARDTALASLPASQGGRNFLADLPDIELPQDKPTRRSSSYTPSRASSYTPSRASSSRVSSGPSEFDQLKESLEREETIIEKSYLKRLELIRNNTAEGSEIRASLENKIAEQYQKESAEYSQQQVNQLDISKTGYVLELEELNNYYQQRKELILSSTATTGEEKKALELRLEEERSATIAQLKKGEQDQQLQLAGEFFGGIAQLSGSHSKKLATIGKAAAIAQATIKTYESATSAYAAMAAIPVVGPALGVTAAAAAVATGLANVSAIRSQSVGNYAQGGIIPGSSFTGDNLQANVNSGEMVLNKMQQANLFNLANNPKNNNQAVAVQNQTANNGNLNITVLPTAGTTADIKQDPNNPQNLEIILRKVDEKLTSDLQTGDGQFIPALTTRVPALRQA